VKFWDASAIVPLLSGEMGSEAMNAMAAADPEITVWWGTEVECASALSRAERQAPAAGRAFPDLYQRLAQMACGWVVVEPCPELKATAVRMLRVHALRAADALQLAAALIACHYDPNSLAFVTRDDRLALAADREGFPLAWKR